MDAMVAAATAGLSFGYPCGPYQNSPQPQQQHYHHQPNHHHYHHHQPPQPPPQQPTQWAPAWGPPPPAPSAGQVQGPSALDIIHSLAGDWAVSDLSPPDTTFSGLKVHADGSFHCTGGAVRRGEITVSSPAVREVALRGDDGGVFCFSVTPDGSHMAGKDMLTGTRWHLEKRAPQHRPRPVASSLSSDQSNSSEITQARLKELIRDAYRAGRASAVDSNTTRSSNSSRNINISTAAMPCTEAGAPNPQPPRLSFQHLHGCGVGPTPTQSSPADTSLLHESRDVVGSDFVEVVDDAAEAGHRQGEGAGLVHCPVFGRVRPRRHGADHQQRALSKDLALCRDAAAVTGLLHHAKASGLDPNAVCLSTAAHRVARLNGSQEAVRTQVFDMILQDVTTHGLHGWDAQALSKVLWACATASYKNSELFGAAEDFVHHEGLSSFRPQHLAYLAWAFAALGVKATALFEKVDLEIVKRGMGGFNSQDICMSVKGFAGAAQRTAAVFRIAEAEIQKRGLHDFNQHEIVMILGAFAAVGFRCSGLLQVLDRTAGLGGFGAQNLAAVAKSAALLTVNETNCTSGCAAALQQHTQQHQQRPDRFFAALEAEVSERVVADKCPATSLSILVWSVVRVGRESTPTGAAMLRDAAGVLLSQGLTLLALSELVLLTWAYAKVAPSSEVIPLVCKEVKRRNTSIGAHLSSCETLLFLSSLSASPSDDTTAASLFVAKGLCVRRWRFFKDAELAATVRLLAGMGSLPDTTAQKAASEIKKRNFKSWETGNLVDIAWVYCRQTPSDVERGVDSEVIGLVAREVERRHSRLFSPAQLAGLAWAMTVAGQKQAANKCVSEALKRPSSAFTAPQLADLVFSCLKGGVDVVPLLRKVELDLKARGFVPYGQHATTVALLFFAALPPEERRQWLVLRTWVPLPPPTQPPSSLIAAASSLEVPVEIRGMVAQIKHNILLPDQRVVIETIHDVRPSFSTTSIVELKRAALSFEDWKLLVLNWGALKPAKRVLHLEAGLVRLGRCTQQQRLRIANHHNKGKDDDEQDERCSPPPSQDDCSESGPASPSTAASVYHSLSSNITTPPSKPLQSSTTAASDA